MSDKSYEIIEVDVDGYRAIGKVVKPKANGFTVEMIEPFKGPRAASPNVPAMAVKVRGWTNCDGVLNEKGFAKAQELLKDLTRAEIKRRR